MKRGSFVFLVVSVALIVTIVTPAGFVAAESGVCVRKEKNKESEILEVLPIGTEVKKGKGKWTKYEDGYILTEWISDENPLSELGDWRITAYASTGCACANGEMPEVGETIAQNTLEFGTKVYIEGVGVRVVEDRGPTSLGAEWCDLYLGDTQTCVNWGDQVREVYLVKEEVAKK